jgi:hypothetical protein
MRGTLFGPPYASPMLSALSVFVAMKIHPGISLKVMGWNIILTEQTERCKQGTYTNLRQTLAYTSLE